MAKCASHDEYIEEAPPQFHDALVRLRAQLAEALPEADEAIMYDMPGFGFGMNVVAGYAALSKHCGLDVSSEAKIANAEVIAAAGFKATKTGVAFSPKKPISDDLISKLALASREELGV